MTDDFLQSHLRARQLLAEMFIGKWKDAIPQELRHEVGLVLFGHEESAGDDPGLRVPSIGSPF